MLIHVLAFLYAVALSSSDITQIHNEMTEDELRLIFQTSRERVPPYVIVPILHNFKKRSIDSTQVIKLRAFDRNVELYLNPNDVLLAGTHTPVWTVFPDKISYGGLRYQKLNDAFRNIGKPYQDLKSQSAVVLSKNEIGALQIHGNILTNYFISPLPYRLSNRLSKHRRSLNITTRDSIEKDYHIVYRLPKIDEVNQKGIRFVKRNHSYSDNLINRRHKRRIPDTIFPELLSILDYNLYQVVGGNYHAAILYLLSLWNAVDLRYRILNQPKIRLNLAALIISIGEGGTPYLENNCRDGNEVDADKSLQAMSKFYFQESRFPFATYDMAIALTNFDMCNMVGDEICDTATLGYAYEAGACNRSSFDRMTEAVAIVEDNGGYSAILPATHELAHLLGSPHDGVADSSECPGYEGYIMTGSVTFSENSFQWSSCTRRAFEQFFSSTDANCLSNVPYKGKQLLRILPGKLKTLDEQCEKVYGSRACNYDSSVCTKLECYVPQDGGFCKAVAAAAEGSYCGRGMHCISGKCIAENAKVIPGSIVTAKPRLVTYFSGMRNFINKPWERFQIRS